MRTRAFVLIALVTLPCGLDAQVSRLPRGRTPTPTQPTPLPPEAPVVARALAYQRSRWSTEGYTLVSAIQVPASAGGATSYATYGTGTHADYRYTERFAATLDLTVSTDGGFNAISGTAEFGTRFRPLTPEHRVRPFFDVRAGYMHMYDRIIMPTTQVSIVAGVPGDQRSEAGRYSRGFGGIAGTGVEYSLTSSWALTTGLSAMRNRMTTYQVTAPARIPSDGMSYWMTSFRFALGLKYNATRALHLVQNPAQ